jgi:sec-independent protein translocase protein TatC
MIKDYLAFAIRLLLAFGVIFELPILISFLALAGIVNYKQLIRFSRWFMVIAVLIGAMLTPPDVITQLLLALPLMVLYFLSVLFAYLFGPKVED